MKPPKIYCLVFAMLLPLVASAQSIRTLGYNSTNGQIVAATNVTWTNSFNFSTNAVAAQVRTNLSLGWSALTNTNAATSLLGFTTNGQVVANTGTNVLTFTNTISIQGGPRITEGGVYYGPDNTQFGLNLEEAKIVSVSNNAIVDFGDGNNILANWPITFNNTTNAATTRANLGFSTNLNTLWTATNAASAARALSGSTNTNHPYSGTVALTNTNAVLTFSNGILQSVQ